MKAKEANKIYEDSVVTYTNETVVNKILGQIYKKIEESSKNCKKETTYHFGWLMWPFSRPFPNHMEREIVIEKLREMGYRVNHAPAGHWTINENIIEIGW